METFEEFKKVARKAKTIKEVCDIAAENGLEISLDNAKTLFDELNKEGELSDDDLDRVTGGSSCRFEKKTDPKTGKTLVHVVCD